MGAAHAAIVRTLSLAPTLDGNEFVAASSLAGAGAGRRSGAGNVVAVHLSERQSLRIVMGVAIAICHRRTARRIGDQTAIDAIGVRVIGDDEGAFFSLRGGAAEDDARNSRCCGYATQWFPPP